ncbi:hypothetical protein Hanom_Chr14g01249041 [Helianthus anomalus]
MKLELELGLVRAYLFELELGSQIKPKARARLVLFENNLKRAKSSARARFNIV